MLELFAGVGENRRGGATGLAVRRVVMAVFVTISLLALLNRFGQQPRETSAVGERARLTLSAPATVRGGLFFQSRVDVRASGDVHSPRLVLDRGWTEGMQVNSIEPAPAGETSRDGRLVLIYDTLAAGDRLRIWLQFEVDPINYGRRPYGIELDDGTDPLARLDHDLTVLP